MEQTGAAIATPEGQAYPSSLSLPTDWQRCRDSGPLGNGARCTGREDGNDRNDRMKMWQTSSAPAMCQWVWVTVCLLSRWNRRFRHGKAIGATDWSPLHCYYRR